MPNRATESRAALKANLHTPEKFRRSGHADAGQDRNDRVRPCAYPILGGKQWVVHLVQYPGRSDPLTEDREAAKA